MNKQFNDKDMDLMIKQFNITKTGKSRLCNWISFTIGFLLLNTLLTFGQPPDPHFNIQIKVRELDYNTGANISDVVICKDSGDVVVQTNNLGEASMHQVSGGMISLFIYHPDYKICYQEFSISSDTTLNICLPKHIRIGPWGVDTLEIWKFQMVYYRVPYGAYTFPSHFTSWVYGNYHDTDHWKQILPVYNRIQADYSWVPDNSHVDSLNIYEAIRVMEESTGYNLVEFTKTGSKDTTWTINMNLLYRPGDPWGHTAAFGTDVNGHIIKGWSSNYSYDRIGVLTHEIATQFDVGRTNGQFPTNSDSNIQTGPAWLPVDGDNLAFSLQQLYAKQRGEQVLFISQLGDYISPLAPSKSNILFPINNGINIDTLITIIGSKYIYALSYEFKITTDQEGTDAVFHNVTDRPRILVDLGFNKTYFVFERAINDVGIGQWSNPVKFTTRAKDSYVGITNIITPVNNSIDVVLPTRLSWGAALNANTYQLQIAKDSSFMGLVKDIILAKTDTSILLDSNIPYYVRARGIKETFLGLWSKTITFKTKDYYPGNISFITPTYPSNWGMELPVKFTWTDSKNAIKYHLIIHGTPYSNIIKDIFVSKTDTSLILSSGKDYYITVSGVSELYEGTPSFEIRFSVKDYVPYPTGLNYYGAKISNPITISWVNNTLPNDPKASTKFHLEIATDSLFTNIIIDVDVLKKDTTLILDPGKFYFARVRGMNIFELGPWSNIIKFRTYFIPGATSITAPINNSIKVIQPITFKSSVSINAEQYRWIIKNDQNVPIIDTLINNPSGFTYSKLQSGKTFKVTVQPLNSDISGSISPESIFTTIKNTPGAISMTAPINNATEVFQPISFTSTTGAYAEGYGYELKTQDNAAVLDTLLSRNGFSYAKLNGNRSFKIRGFAFNSDVEGTRSEWITFKTYNHAPGSWSITEPIQNAVVTYINKKLPIISTAAIDLDNDLITKDHHIVGPKLDTIIHANNIESIYLDSTRLQPDTEYTLTGTATDGSKVTPANAVITFRTPKPTTGIEDIILDGDIFVYPNPTNQNVTLKYYLLKNLRVNICLFNQDGKKLIYQSFDNVSGSQSHLINLSSIGKGIYILSLETFDSGLPRLIKTFKIVKN